MRNTENDRIITLHQPWASAIAKGIKGVETRSYPISSKYFSPNETKNPGRLYIHSGQKDIEDSDIEIIKTNSQKLEIEYTLNWDLPKGIILCECEVLSCRKITQKIIDTTSNLEKLWGYWEIGRWAWYLKVTKVFTEEIKHKGQQKLHLVPPSIRVQIDSI